MEKTPKTVYAVKASAKAKEEKTVFMSSLSTTGIEGLSPRNPLYEKDAT